MASLKDPFVIKIFFFIFSFIAIAVSVYILFYWKVEVGVVGLVADILGIITFIIFSGPTMSDLIRRKNQMESVKKDVSSFIQNFVNTFEQLFPTLTPSPPEVKATRQKITIHYKKKCEKGEITELDSEIKLNLSRELILDLLSKNAPKMSEGVLNFFVFATSKRLGAGDVAKFYIDQLDEKSINKQESWQYSFCRCLILYENKELEFASLREQINTVNKEKVKEEYYILKGQLEIYTRLKKLSEDANYRDLYEGLKEQIAEILHKAEISHITLRQALASEKTDLVCVVKWAESGYDVLGAKFEKLGWVSPADTRTIQISPIIKTPVKKDFDLNQWVEEKFQLDEIDTPYRLVAIKFNVKDMIVRAYKRSDQFSKDVIEGISRKIIEELIFSEAESLKELIDKSDLSLLIPTYSQEIKATIRKEDARIRENLRARGFQQINSPLDLRFYEKQADRIAEVIRDLRKGNKKIFNEDDARKISSEFIKNAKRFADIAL